MGRKITLMSDLSGREGTEKDPVDTHVFMWAGMNYEIELTKTEADRAEQSLIPLILKARQITPLRAKAVASSDGQSAAREWAKAQKNDDGSPRFPDLAERGRLPQEVWDAYATRKNGDPVPDGNEPEHAPTA